MASAAVERVLGGLEHVRRSGGGWMARCPAHEDRSPSLAISEGDDGRVLLYCHAGCSFEQIVAALGLRPGELFPGSWTNGDRLHSLPKPSPPTRTVSPATLDRMRRLTRPKWTRESEPRSEVPSLTLAQYADHFKLPVDFLRKAGLEDSTWKDRDWTEPRPAVRIPYRDEAGNVVAIRYRFALGKSGFRWQKGARSCLYGLPGLAAARKAGFVTLCEGESDTQVLRFHRFPAVGVPGASTWRDEWAADLEGLRVYLVQEPDQGGRALLEKLARSPVADRVRVVKLKDTKDAAELHVRDPDSFRSTFKTALRAAVRLDTAEQVPPPTPDKARPEISRQRPAEGAERGPAGARRRLAHYVGGAQ